MSTETCYATIISHRCALTHAVGGGSVTAFGHVGSSIGRETCRRDGGLVQITPFCYHTVSAVMLPVGTQPLDSQHPPLAAPPLGSDNTKKTFPPAGCKQKPPGEEGREKRSSGKGRRPYLSLLLLLLLESDGRACFSGCTEEQRGNKQRGALRWRPLPLGIS